MGGVSYFSEWQGTLQKFSFLSFAQPKHETASLFFLFPLIFHVKNKLNTNWCVLFENIVLYLHAYKWKICVCWVHMYVCVSVCLYFKGSLTQVENTPSLFILKHLHFQWIRCCLQTFVALVCVNVSCISIALQKHSSLRIEAQTMRVSKHERNVLDFDEQDVGVI